MRRRKKLLHSTRNVRTSDVPDRAGMRFSWQLKSWHRPRRRSMRSTKNDVIDVGALYRWIAGTINCRPAIEVYDGLLLGGSPMSQSDLGGMGEHDSRDARDKEGRAAVLQTPEVRRALRKVLEEVQYLLVEKDQNAKIQQNSGRP